MRLPAISASALLALAMGCTRSSPRAGGPDPAAPAAPSPVVASASAAASTSASASKPVGGDAGASMIREEKHVDVDGVRETWRLVWRTPPEPACVDATWSTCLCAGLAFGETGALDLVRTRPGAPDERLDLSRSFEGLVLRRWPPTHADPIGEPIPIDRLRSRPDAEVMKLADYDHDGRATEFVLQIDAGNPCGRSPAVLVGISARQPSLHVFATPEKPREHLVLEHVDDWEKVRRATAPLTLVELACGDHGSDEEHTLAVRIDPAGIHAQPSARACPAAAPP